SPSGGSTRTTSAPRSASNFAAYTPTSPARSRTRKPSSAASAMLDVGLDALREAAGEDLRGLAHHVLEDLARGTRLVQHPGDLPRGVHQQLEPVGLARRRHDLARDDALHAHRQRVELLRLPVFD